MIKTLYKKFDDWVKALSAMKLGLLYGGVFMVGPLLSQIFISNKPSFISLPILFAGGFIFGFLAKRSEAKNK